MTSLWGSHGYISYGLGLGLGLDPSIVKNTIMNNVGRFFEAVFILFCFWSTTGGETATAERCVYRNVSSQDDASPIRTVFEADFDRQRGGCNRRAMCLDGKVSTRSFQATTILVACAPLGLRLVPGRMFSCVLYDGMYRCGRIIGHFICTAVVVSLGISPVPLWSYHWAFYRTYNGWVHSLREFHCNYWRFV